MEFLFFLITRYILFYCCVALIYMCFGPAEDAEFESWD
jgi:hypothetical protein